MKCFYKKIAGNKNLESKEFVPFPLEVIPNKMGINLCSVDSVAWQEMEDGQLVNLTISFLPK